MNDLRFAFRRWVNDTAFDSVFAAGNLVDDLFFFVEGDGAENAVLYVDEVVLFDAGTVVEAPKPKPQTPRKLQGSSTKTATAAAVPELDDGDELNIEHPTSNAEHRTIGQNGARNFEARCSLLQPCTT